MTKYIPMYVMDVITYHRPAAHYIVFGTTLVYLVQILNATEKQKKKLLANRNEHCYMIIICRAVIIPKAYLSTKNIINSKCLFVHMVFASYLSWNWHINAHKCGFLTIGIEQNVLWFNSHICWHNCNGFFKPYMLECWYNRPRKHITICKTLWMDHVIYNPEYLYQWSLHKHRRVQF